MAGKGPAPKDPHARVRRNKSEPLTLLATDGSPHGPALPESHDWPQQTIDWWETWRRSPQASTFTETDWSFLLDTAVLHADYWLGDRSVASELRLRAAKFGATPEDRARLKIAVGDPNPAERLRRLQPKGAKARRERVLKAVGDE